MSQINLREPDRRRFLGRLARAGLAAAGASALGLSLWSGRGSRTEPGRASLSGLPDFSLPALKGRLSLVQGSDRAAAVRAAILALGGIEAFVRPGDRVLIKVNAAFASPPALGATTHPELLAEVARLCLAAGAARVAVTDNPINDPAACFELTGLAGAARSAGARLIPPRPDLFRRLSLEGGRLIRDWPVLAGPLLEADKLIGLAPVKDHSRAGASLSLKNFYGFLGGRRSVFHQRIDDIIAELALLVRPSLVVLDGIVAMTTNGPTGGSLADLKATRTMIAATDPVAADSLAATLLGRSAGRLPYLAKAEALGLGRTDYESLNPVRLAI